MDTAPDAVALPISEEQEIQNEKPRRPEELATGLNAELAAQMSRQSFELENTRRELRDTLNKAQAFVQKLDGTITSWNLGSEKLYGWSQEEAVGRNSLELLGSEFQKPLHEILVELLENDTWSGEYSQRDRNGSTLWIAGQWTLHRDINGKPHSVVKLHTNITALKNSNDALQLSEATSKSLFENAGQGILTTDGDGKIVEVNAVAQQIFRYSRAELVGASVDMLLPDGLRGLHKQHRASYKEHPSSRTMGEDRNLLARRKDGSEVPVEISLSFVAHLGTSVLMAFISDISERMKAKCEREALIAELKDALAEKTALLGEVHHRVKNNLSIISGLLEMQAETLDNVQARQALEKSHQRVMSMAMIHENLYASEHMVNVNFGRYLQELASDLGQAYALDPGVVETKVEAEEIELPVDYAIPCGLIVNELISNSMKYAFPEGRRGTIKMSFGKTENGAFLLSCQDDGVGMAQKLDWKTSKSLGLRIVKILADQLDGELMLSRGENLTRFELRFSAVK